MGDSSADGCEVRTDLCFICGCKMKKFYMGKDYVLLSYASVLDEYYFDFHGLSHKALMVSFAVGHTAASR
jgi:hypothetical protein